MAQGSAGSFTSLRIRDFRILWVGTIFSFLAFFMSMLVQSVVAFEISGNNSAVGIIVFAQGVAMLLLGPIGGALADRWAKRRVVVIAQSVAGVVLLATAALIAVGAISIAWLAASALLTGAAIAFVGPSRQGMVVEIVPLAIRGNAMAINNLGNTGSRVLGPLVAGFLLAWEYSGASGTYLAMALLYFISASAMGLLSPSSVVPPARDRHVFADVADGLVYVYRERRLRLLMSFFAAVILLGFPHVMILPGLA
ncbi:MFS transporter, partial [Myxococcota bacterium]|nr:MFS transporter [Myxococcota bacterium]